MIDPVITGKGKSETDDISLEYYNVDGLRFIRMTWQNRVSGRILTRTFRLVLENYGE